MKRKKKVCVILLRKDKAEYLQKLNADLSDIKTFWKTMKSYFSKQRFEFKQIDVERKEPTYY